MKVLLISSQDWANFQHNMYLSLKSVGVDVKSVKLGRHLFGYDEQSDVITPSQIPQLVADHDTIIVCHSDWELIEGIDATNKVIIPFHTGTKYRQSPELINSKFTNSPFTLIALPEFQQTAPNPKYIVGAVDINMPTKELGDRLVIGHFPSNPDVKGTNDIIRIVDDIKRTNDFDFIWSKDRVSHSESLQRINSCDIYIELLASEQGGKPYGSFGITGLEAAALGKIVITQSLNDNGIYNETYGVNMLNLVKDEAGLRKTLTGMLNYKGDYIRGQQALTKDWIKQHHSYEATGNKLKQWIISKS